MRLSSPEKSEEGDSSREMDRKCLNEASISSKPAKNVESPISYAVREIPILFVRLAHHQPLRPVLPSAEVAQKTASGTKRRTNR